MTREREGTSSHGQPRGQLVLAMAVVVTVALVPIAAAYMQLGYPGEGSTGQENGAAAVDRALGRSVVETGYTVTCAYTWANRSAMVDAVRRELEPRFDAFRTGHGGMTAGITIAYNQTDAATLATTACPRGPGRQFGSCEAHSGVVVQERDGDAAVIGVSLDVEVTGPDRTVNFTRRYMIGWGQ